MKKEFTAQEDRLATRLLVGLAVILVLCGMLGGWALTKVFATPAGAGITGTQPSAEVRYIDREVIVEKQVLKDIFASIDELRARSEDVVSLSKTDLVQLLQASAQEGEVARRFLADGGLISVASEDLYQAPTTPLFVLDKDGIASMTREPIDLWELFAWNAAGVRVVGVQAADMVGRMTGKATDNLVWNLNPDKETKTVGGIMDIFQKGKVLINDPNMIVHHDTSVQAIMINFPAVYRHNAKVAQLHWKQATPRKTGTKVPANEDVTLWFAFDGKETSFPVYRYAFHRDGGRYPGTEEVPAAEVVAQATK